MMDLTIIIPCFNAAATLSRAVSSATASFPGAEIIIVDDGSTDGTAGLAGSLDGNITVLSQENRGVSAARNAGIAAASGEWICFLDADDTLGNDAILPSGPDLPDILVMRSFSGNSERYPWGSLFMDGDTVTPDSVLRKGYLRGSVCGCLFRRAFLEESALRFPEGIKLSEDSVFFAAALSKASSIRFSNAFLYRVWPSESSASRKGGKESVKGTDAAIEAAVGMIPDGLVLRYLLFKLILTLTSRAVDAGISASEVLRSTSVGSRLPISTSGLVAELWKIRLLNFSYPLFHTLIRVRNRLQGRSPSL